MNTERKPSNGDQALQMFNESFYASDPADYLLTRLQLLLLAGGKRGELQQLFEEGVEYAGVSLAPPPPDSQSGPDAGTVIDLEDPDEEAKKLDMFLVIEAQSLLHQACETVLRMFFVHASPAVAPWINLAAERDFGKFKKRVRSELIEKELGHDLVARVCLGSPVPPDDATGDEWARAVEGIIAFFRTFARCFLDDANLYNGIKHGLGVSPSEATFLINEYQFAAGPSVKYPESGQWEHGRREWSLVTRWIDMKQSLALTYVAIQLIASMWTVGRAQHCGGKQSGRVFFPSTLRPSDLRTNERPPGTRMSWPLLVEVRDRL